MKLKKSHIFLAIIAVVFVAVYVYCFDSKPDMNGDNAQYVRLAQNMASGLGYSNVTTDGIVPASHYPPGYPAFLAFIARLGFPNLTLFKILNGVFLLVSLFLMFIITKKVTKNEILAFSAVILTIFSPRLINFSYMIMSEMSYMLLTIVVLYALYKETENEDKSEPFWKSKYFYVAIIAAAASYYIRTVGISSIFGIFIFYACRKDWKKAVASVVGVFLLLLPWSIRNSVVGVESRYLGTVMTVNPWRPEEGSISSFGEMFDKMLTNFDDTVIKGFSSLIFSFAKVDYKNPSDTLWIVFGLIVLAIIIFGVFKMGKLKYYLLAFLLANIGLFLLWHGGNQNRYVIPLIPYLFVLFFVGFHKLIRLKYKYSPLIYLLMLGFMISPIKNIHYISGMPYPNGYDSYFRALNLLKKIPKGSIVCCRKPEFLVFYANQTIGTNYLYSLETEELVSDLVKKNVDIVILDNLGFSSTVRYLYPAIMKHEDLFTPLHKVGEPETYIIEFDKKKAIEQGF